MTLTPLLFVTPCAVIRHLPCPHCRVQISNDQLALDVSWVGPVAVMAAMDVATISPADAKLQVDPETLPCLADVECFVFYFHVRSKPAGDDWD